MGGRANAREPGFYKVPVSRAFAAKLWAAHLLQRKSISRIVTEALLAHFGKAAADAATLAVDDEWEPRQPRQKHGRKRT